MSKNLLTVQEFADEVGCTASCVRKAIHQRRLTTVKIFSKLVRIPRSEVTRIIEAGFRPAKPVCVHSTGSNPEDHQSQSTSIPAGNNYMTEFPHTPTDSEQRR